VVLPAKNLARGFANPSLEASIQAAAANQIGGCTAKFGVGLSQQAMFLFGNWVDSFITFCGESLGWNGFRIAWTLQQS
jgi:hypothetical protein